MKKLLLVAGAVIMLSLWLSGIAMADNGVHGGYSSTTDACAGCHRAHTAKGARLLKVAATTTNVSGFCLSCHSNGTGAYTDVQDGLFLTTATVEPSLEVSTTLPGSNEPLKGGGFLNVTMDPALTGTMTLSTTSSHMITGGSNTVWGYGGITSTTNYGATGVTLTCTNCHNPHGGGGTGDTATYRILKGNNVANTALFTNTTTVVTANIDVPDEVSKRYYINDPGGNYFGENYGTLKSTLSDWCVQCHSRYEGLSGSGSSDSTDAVFEYRHDANGTGTNGTYGAVPGCITCHVAHGTGARMGTNSGGVPYPDTTTATSNNARSSLLRLDNRGVCQQCHHKK